MSRRWDGLIVAPLAAVAAFLVAGCAQSDPEQSADVREMKAALKESFNRPPPVAPRAGSVAAAQGPTPLAYITERAAQVSVTDQAGRRWGPVFVEARSVVRVADKTGVAIGEFKYPGELAPGGTYTVHLASPDDRGWNAGVQQAVPTKK